MTTRINQSFDSELATVADHGMAVSSEKKTPYIWIDFVFDELQSDAQDDLGVRAYLYLTDGTLPFVLDKLQNLGWHGRSLTELDTDTNGKILLNRKARLTGVMEEYDGKPRPVVKFINHPDSTRMDNPISKDDLSILSKKFDAKIAAYCAKNKVKQSKEQTDSIPF